MLCLSMASSIPTKCTLSSARICSQVMLGRLLRRLSIIYGERPCLLTRLYCLAPPGSQNDYGTEALEAIMATIEGGTATTSDRPAIKMAGYPQEMDCLVALNQGLKRRVTHVFQFEDYNPREIYCILSPCARRMALFSVVMFMMMLSPQELPHATMYCLKWWLQCHANGCSQVCTGRPADIIDVAWHHAKERGTYDTIHEWHYGRHWPTAALAWTWIINVC